MENKHKQFKPFDRVLVREINPYWSCDLYSHFNSDSETHETTALRNIKDKDILPYEGNEHLIGTPDEPEEEIELKEGELAVFSDFLNGLQQCNGIIEKFDKIVNTELFPNQFKVKADTCYTYCVKFSDFNPNDMEETRKHILRVKNGKVVRYKE